MPNKAPENCETTYIKNSLNDNRLSINIARETAGLKCPPEICPNVKMAEETATPKAIAITISFASSEK